MDIFSLRKYNLCGLCRMVRAPTGQGRRDGRTGTCLSTRRPAGASQRRNDTGKPRRRVSHEGETERSPAPSHHTPPRARVEESDTGIRIRGSAPPASTFVHLLCLSLHLWPRESESRTGLPTHRDPSAAGAGDPSARRERSAAG
jgi:hypothetical protein